MSSKTKETGVIGLVYCQSAPLASLTFTDNPTFPDANCALKFFNPALYIRPIIETAGENGTTISGRYYERLNTIRRKHVIKIEFDEFDEVSGGSYLLSTNDGIAGIEFFQNFWIAKYKYIAFKINTVATSLLANTYSDFKRVECGFGNVPLSYDNEQIYFPNISLELIENLPISRSEI